MRRRLATVPDVVQDALLAIVLAAVAIASVSIVAHQHDDPNEHAPAIAIVLLLIEHLPLAVRRRHPVAVWFVTGIAACVYGMAPSLPTRPRPSDDRDGRLRFAP